MDPSSFIARCSQHADQSFRASGTVCAKSSGYIESVVDIDIGFQLRMGHVSHLLCLRWKGLPGGLFVSSNIMAEFDLSVGAMTAGRLEISGRAEAM
jgi:hypothetical protein